KAAAAVTTSWGLRSFCPKIRPAKTRRFFVHCPGRSASRSSVANERPCTWLPEDGSADDGIGCAMKPRGRRNNRRPRVAKCELVVALERFRLVVERLEDREELRD